MRKGIPNPGVLTPGEWPTHPAPASTQSVKPVFLSTELNWKRIWKGVRWPLLAMIVLYVCGFSVEVGPSMNHLGWIYITKWGSLPTQSGQIIRLAPANLPWWRKYILGSQVKRYTGSIDNLYGYEGDNAEWSADNRDGLKPIPADHIAGVVVAAISPMRIFNSFTAEGRFENWVNWNFRPSTLVWRPDHLVVAVKSLGRISIFDSRKMKLLDVKYDEMSWEGQPLVWRNGRLAYKPDSDNPFLWAIWDYEGPDYRFDVRQVYDDRCNQKPKFGKGVIGKFEVMAADFGGNPRIIHLPSPIVASSVAIEHSSAAPVKLTVAGKTIDANLGQSVLDLGFPQKVGAITISFSGAGHLPTAEVQSITFR